MYTNKTRKNSLVYNSFITSPILLLVSLVIFLPDICLARITKGPFLLRAYQNRAAVMWETDTQGAGKLLYCTNIKEKPNHIVTEPQPLQYETRHDPNNIVKKTVFIHKTWLENLQPGRPYFYRIIDSESKSDFYSFRTVPADTNEVTFVVYGDSRTYPKTHRKIVEQIAKKNVDFVVHTGDLVTNGDHYDQWGPQFFEPLKGLSESVPVYIAKGNHEGYNGNFEKLLIPPGEKNNFAFDYGPLHYFCADNIAKGLNPKELLEQIASDIKSSKAQWKFISYHIPSLNLGGHWSNWGSPEVFGVFADAGVDFVITGHSHQYERFHPVAPPRLPVGRQAWGRGGSFVTYITSGGGGGPLYGVEPTIYHARAKKMHHSCWFHIKADKLTMDAIDINGNIIDHLEVTKTNGKLNRQYLETAVSAEEVQSYRDAHEPQEKSLR
jgi:predicted phosphodiesterase